MKFEFPEINKVCFETESIADADGGAGTPTVHEPMGSSIVI